MLEDGINIDNITKYIGLSNQVIDRIKDEK